MFKQGAMYLLARLSPAIASFFVLAVYTRYMSEAQYGIFSLLLVVASASHNFLFGWLYVGMMRFWNQQAETTQVQRLIMAAVLGTSLCVAVFALLFGWLTQKLNLVLPFILLFWGLAAYEAAQRIHSMTLRVKTYAVTEILRTLLTSAIGIGLVIYGWHWWGAIAALIIGLLLALCLSGAVWRYFWLNPLPFNTGLFKQLLQYGLPLSISLVLLEIIHISDRILLTYLDGYAAAGQYSVAFNVPHQIIMMLMSSANLAAYPMVIRALEKQGKAVAQQQLAQYSLVLFGVSIPAVFGLISIIPDFVPLLLGENFADSALQLMPWVTGVVLLNCSYLFYVSLAFQLANRTRAALKVVGLAAVVNVMGNIALIPVYGAKGALIASVLAYGICVVYGLIASKDYFHLPLLWWEWGKIVLAAMIMFAGMALLPWEAGIQRGLSKIALGIAMYAALVLLLDIGSIRSLLKQIITKNTLQAKP